MTAVPTTNAHNSSKTTTPANIAETGVYAISQSGTPIGRLVIVGSQQHWFLNEAFQPIGSTDASRNVRIAYEGAYDGAGTETYRDAKTTLYIRADCSTPQAATATRAAATPAAATQGTTLFGRPKTAPTDQAETGKSRQIDPGFYSIVQGGQTVGKVAAVPNTATGSIEEQWTFEPDPSTSVQYKPPSAANATVDLLFQKTMAVAARDTCSLIASCRVMP